MDESEKVLVGAGYLSRFQTVDPKELVRPQDGVAADIPLPAAEVGDLLCLSQSLLAFTERCLGLLPLRDVAQDARGAYDPPRAIFDWSGGQGHIEQAAILPATHGLNTGDTLSARGLGKECFALCNLLR